MMSPDELVVMLIRDEGLRLKPYRDRIGKLTIGIGRNLDDVGISVAEARMLAKNDIAKVIAGLDRATPWWQQLSDSRQLVLANMAFNLGVGGLVKFRRFLGALRTARYDEAAEHMLDSLWARQVGARAERLAAMMRKG